MPGMDEQTDIHAIITRIQSAESFVEIESEFGDPGEVLRKWTEACCKKIGEDQEVLAGNPPETLDAVERTQDETTFTLFGVVHGWAGGASAAYHELVEKSLDGHEHVLFEKMLGNFYGQGSDVQIPDFWVLGVSGQFLLGLRMMLLFPLFIFESARGLLREIRTREDPEITDIYSIMDSTCYHNIDPELRRGLGGSFPTRLQIEYEMSVWQSPARYYDSEMLVAVVPRSAYIAEFARAFAREKHVERLAVVVGDRHLTEVEYFLRTPVNDERLRAAAWRHARRISGNRFWYHLMFSVYMLNVCLGAAIGSLPYMALLLWLM